MELIDLIIEALEEKPGLTYLEIAKRLGVNHKIINPAIYANMRLFNKGQGTTSAPVWYLKASGTPFIPYERSGTPKREVKPTPDSSIKDEFSQIFVVQDFDPEILKRFEKNDNSPRPEAEIPEVSLDNPYALYRWQREALTAWAQNSKRGIVDAVTGAGKTRVGLAAMQDHLNEGGKTLILVPTVVLLYQWRDAILEHSPEALVGLVGDGHQSNFNSNDVIVATLASAKNRQFVLGTKVGLLIADECHRAAAKEYRKALGVGFSKRLGLSATHERLDDEHTTVLLPYFDGVVFELDYRRAIDDGVVASVDVTFLGVRFTKEEEDQYIETQRALSSLRRKLISDFGCRAQPFTAFLEDVTRLSKQGTRAEGMVANNWLTKWHDKKGLLAQSPAKMQAIASLSDQIRESGTALVFTQTIEAANEIETALDNCGVRVALHHSGITTDERQANLQGFADASVSCLVTVQTLEEGVDVPDADLGIIVASTKQRRQMVQRMGRVMRRKPDGRDAKFVIMFVEMTDEDPRLGAHEAFVDELIDVARASRIVISK